MSASLGVLDRSEVLRFSLFLLVGIQKKKKKKAASLALSSEKLQSDSGL